MVRIIGLSAIAVAILLPGLAPKNASASTPGKLQELIAEMEQADEAFVRALEKSVDGLKTPRDQRPGILNKIDDLAKSTAGTPQGEEVAWEAFESSWYRDLDLDNLIKRFERLANNYPNGEFTQEAVYAVPDAFSFSGTPQQWKNALQKLADATQKKETKLVAQYSTGLVDMQRNQLKEAKEFFRKVIKLDAKSDHAQMAKGFLFEIENLQIGMPAPAFTAKLLDGGRVSLKSLRGKVVLLNFWATWCPHCIAEFPYLRTAATQLKGKPFEILAVSLDQNRREVHRLLSASKLPGIHALEMKEGENPVATLYNVVALPTVYLIDAKGIIRARDLEGSELILAIMAALNLLEDK